MNEPINRLKVAGDNILMIRVSRRMSQSALAKKAGVSRSTIVAIEAGKPTSTDKLIKIAAALGVEISDLFESRGEKAEWTHRATVFFKKISELMELEQKNR